jgi:predicted SPOUT superfamily RNA methylase MTH1
VYDDGQGNSHSKNGSSIHHSTRNRDFGNDDSYTALTDPDGFLVYLLSYLECPPHLRRKLFPIHPNLRGVGSLPPLDIPHHIKAGEWCQYREGVTVGPTYASAQKPDNETPRKKQKKNSSHSKSKTEANVDQETLVDVGFPIAVPVEIPPNTRVTVKFSDLEPPSDFPYSRSLVEIGPKTEPVLMAEPIAPSVPREEAGYYWGYTVRRAASLSSIFTECPFEEGYDISIGTSERGQSLFNLLSSSAANPLPTAVSHALLVFGGLGGLEVAAAADEDLASKGIDQSNIADLFDYYVDICPGQGSRTIRSEEAILITLAQLRSWTATAIQ